MDTPFSTTDARMTAPSFPNDSIGCKRMMRMIIGEQGAEI
jgi:hypothetical protein